MIKVTAGQRFIRETTAPFEFNDEKTGDVKTEDIVVRYFSPTTLEKKTERDAQVARAKEMSEVLDAQRASEAALKEVEAAERKLTASPDDKALQSALEKAQEKADTLAFAAKDKAKDAADKYKYPWLADSLAKRLESLPNLCDGDEKPFPITSESLSLVPIVNLMAIEKAIEDDLVPKTQPSN